MSRFIKDSEAKQSLYAMFGVTSSAAVTAIDIAIDKTPTADVQEVKHGKWIFENGWITCSNCKATPYKNYNHIDFDNLYKFCPHCGAKMDGD